MRGAGRPAQNTHGKVDWRDATDIRLVFSLADMRVETRRVSVEYVLNDSLITGLDLVKFRRGDGKTSKGRPDVRQVARRDHPGGPLGGGPGEYPDQFIEGLVVLQAAGAILVIGERPAQNRQQPDRTVS